MKIPITEETAEQVVKASFYMNNWWPGSNQYPGSIQYTCQISNENPSMPKVIKEVEGNHMSTNTNEDVKGIRFDSCKMTFVPRGLTSLFPNLQILLIYNSDIKKLKKNDFEGFGQLKQLWLSGLQLEYLPGNLLHNMPNLEIVSVQSCNVKYIDADILDNLPNLKVAKFNLNLAINAFYDFVSSKKIGGITLKELKQKIKEIGPPSGYDVSEYTETTVENQIKCSKRKNKPMPYSVFADIKDFVANEKYKDLTISVDGEEFKVHKFVLAARCAVLADLIYKNQQETLELTNVSKEIFQDILTYIYNDTLPDINNNGYNLFLAACQFDLNVLKKHVIWNMTTEVTAENAVEMLIYGKLYGNETLEKSALDKIKEMFPDRELSDELIEDTEKLKKIIQAKKVMDEKIKLAKEEFEQMGFFD